MKLKLKIYKSKFLSQKIRSNWKIKKQIDFYKKNRLIDDEQPAASTRAAFGWRQYYGITDIYEWLDQMLRRYPGELTSYNIGKTFEKRTIRGIKFSRQPDRV